MNKNLNSKLPIKNLNTNKNIISSTQIKTKYNHINNIFILFIKFKF